MESKPSEGRKDLAVGRIKSTPEITEKRQVIA